MRRLIRLATLIALPASLGCGDREVPAAELGASLFRSRALSTSPLNDFSCSTCHVVAPGAPAVISGRLDSGYNLAGAAARPSWWGSYATRLLDAINICLDDFMGGRRLQPEDDEARQLGEYLAANSPEPSAPALPFTIVRAVTPLDGLTGDVARGRDIYLLSCHRCHGDVHTGAGRLSARVSVVPEDTVKAFPDHARHGVVEKVRHGKFFNIGGVMPLYSLETLSDEQLADVLAYLGL